jgi:hypothetical protein
MVILRHISTWPPDERRPQRLNLLKNIGTHYIDSIARQQGDLVKPKPALSVEQNHKLSQRIALTRSQSEFVLLPISGNVIDLA